MPSDEVGAGGGRISGKISPWMFAVLIAAAVSAVSYPNLHGFWGRDDFAQLALARMIGAPWALFTTDHFFVAGSIFRPLGFFSQWLCVKMFGTDYAPNAAFDIALHAAVALCLFRVLLRPSIPPLIAALCALLFALHPVTIGPSLWWSARFDVQSTLFILLAVMAGMRYRERITTLSLICALLASLAAVLSKENGLVATAALTLLWGRWIFIAPSNRTRAVTAIALAWLLTIGFFLWRRMVLDTFSTGVTGPVSLTDAIQRGLLNWLRDAPGYLSFFPHLAAAEIGLIAIACLVALTALIASRFSRSETRGRVDVDIVLVGLLLFVSPIITQSPIAAFASPLSADMSAIEAGMQSRLYYLQTSGLMLMLAAAIGPLYRAADRLPRLAITWSMAVAAATFAWISHGNAREFGERSFAIASPARAAVAAIEPLHLPDHHCHIAFLGYEPAPEWSSYVSMDSIVKGLSTRKSIRGCWIHSDVPTFFRLQSASAAVDDALPYHPLQAAGKQAPWRHVGKLVFAYVVPPDKENFSDSDMLFLTMKNGQFVDVSANVRAGTIPVGLK